MAGRRYLNTAILCFIVLLVSFVLHRPLYSTNRRVLLRHSSNETRKSAKSPNAVGSRVAIPSIDPIHNTFNNLKPRAGPSEAWNTAVSSGSDLLCLMKMTKDEAAEWASKSTKWSPRDPVTSRFNDPKAFDDWGWVTQYDEGDGSGYGIKPELVNFMNKLGLYPKTRTAWASHGCDHAKDWTMNGVKGKAVSQANYRSHFSKGGIMAMVVDTMFSPQHYVNVKSADPPAPDLSRPSDVWFLLYLYHGQKYHGFSDPGPALIQAPSHIFIQEIVTSDVKKLFEELIEKVKIEWPDGAEFDSESEEGRMLIGTKHGTAVAMFLIQHKDFFGDRVIRKIRLWRTQSYRRWSLYFEIGEVAKEEGNLFGDAMDIDGTVSPMDIDDSGDPMDIASGRRVRARL